MSETQLQGRELDAALARALGCNIASYGSDYHCMCADGRHGELSQGNLYDYHDDLNAMHDVEAEMERRFLLEAYVKTLIAGVCGDGVQIFISSIKVAAYNELDGFNVIYAIAHATAEQKARAALAVLSK